MHTFDLATLHTVLHTLMIAGLVSAAVLIVVGMILGKPRGAAPGALAMILFFAAGFCWQADSLLVETHSPSVTLTGPVVRVRKHVGKHIDWYLVTLAVNGSQTEELEWLPTEEPPHRGDVVSMVEPAWKIGDTRSIHVVSGRNAGYDWKVHSTFWFFVVGMVFCVAMGAIIATAWLQTLAGQAAKARLEAQASGAMFPR